MYKFPLNYEYLYEQKDVERVINWLDAAKKELKTICIDLETSGVNPFEDSIVLCQLGNTDKQWILDARTIDLSFLKPYLESSSIHKIGQNIKFDYKFLVKKLGIKMKSVGCTMITEQVLRCGLGVRANMEILCERYFNIKIDKEGSLRGSFKSTPVGQLSQRQLDYAAGDIVYPIEIMRKQMPLIRLRGLEKTLGLEFRVLPVIANMELHGMGIDKGSWMKLYQEALKDRKEAEKELDRLFGVSPTFQENLFGEADRVMAIDYNSPHQLKKALARMGYPMEKTQKVDIALAAIEGRMPKDLAQGILSWRIANTRVTRYGISFLDAIEPATGRIHSDFSQAMTTTGRLSSREDSDSSSDKVNLQNITNAEGYRACFVPAEGYKFCVWDYQAIEPRILGEISQDPTYLEIFDNDKDIYGFIGSKMLGEEVSKAPGRPKELRDKTKITVLGNSYGTGKNKFHRKLLIDMNMDKGILRKEFIDIPQSESDMLWEKFFEVCPNIRDTLDNLSALADPLGTSRRVYDELCGLELPQLVAPKVIQLFTYRTQMSADEKKARIDRAIRNRGHISYSETINGRKRFFKVYHPTAWTEGRNHPIQGTAADILKTAMVLIQDAIDTHGYDARIINQVHDELIVEVKDEQAEQVNEMVKTLCLTAERMFLKRVPPKVEGGIKDRWEK